MVRRIEVVITYLEQKSPPALREPTPPRDKIAIMRVTEPPLHFYRYLYALIGDPHSWVSRKQLSDKALSTIIHHPDTHLHVLYVNGAPAGMAEIDLHDPSQAEIKFFGLAPDFTGRGLGSYFLTHTIKTAWSFGPKRVFLETCTLDHPAALPLYQKFGFNVFDQRKGYVDAPSPEGSNTLEQQR